MNFNKLYLIGEIGINHNGDMRVAKDLMCAVRSTGWSCAKFQKRSPEICVPKEQWGIMRSTPWGEMSYIDYKKKIEFTYDQYSEIARFSEAIGIDWSASVWDMNSLKEIFSLQPKFIKIPSAMMTNSDLLKESLCSGLPVIVSTGMSTLAEVDAAVEIIEKHGNESKVCLMHTNSSYPTPTEELNLSLIPFLRERYGIPVGYSGHESDIEPTVIAVSLGATVIERHITLSHEMWGTDQKSSLEVHAMNMLRKRVEKIPTMLGRPLKKVTESEISVRKKLRGY